jgi:hypothetical protein
MFCRYFNENLNVMRAECFVRIGEQKKKNEKKKIETTRPK